MNLSKILWIAKTCPWWGRIANHCDEGLPQGCDKDLPAITEGYGAEGQCSVDLREISNPNWKSRPIAVFLPRERPRPLPVVFLSHGFGGTSWKKGYAELLRHIASRGYLAIHSPYRTFRTGVEDRYRMLWEGFELAVERCGGEADLDRVGFVGHSFGAGAVPALAHKALTDKGWGTKAAFLFLMAPWYTYGISEEELNAGFPAHVKLVVQVYELDDVNDHRMAIDLYRTIGISEINKDFLYVRSDSRCGCYLQANHAIPARHPSSFLKQWAVFRILDALADCSFENRQQGQVMALGHGGWSQAYMGQWRDGTPYPPLESERDPTPRMSESRYRFPWSNTHYNPRVSHQAC